MTTNTAIVTVDVHGMDKRSAKLYIDQKLAQAGPGVYRIRIVHGFHGGTELRTMVRKVYKTSNSKVIRVEVGLNPGETDLVLREY
nr:hypothetical protein [Clostridia bacterium]